MKTMFIYTLATMISLPAIFATSASAAGTASLSLSPNSGSHVQNSSFTVQVNVNGTDVNVVTAKISYDASKLSCTSVGGSTAFPNTVVATCGGGSVTISRYSQTNVSGSASVGSVSFKALANSGTAVVSFSSGSQIASNGVNIWNGNTTGGSYALTAPAVAQPTQPPSQPAPTTPTTTTPQPSTTSNPSSNTIKKVVAVSTASSATPSSTTSPTPANTTTAGSSQSPEAKTTKTLAITTTSDTAKPTNGTYIRNASIWAIITLIVGGGALYYVRSRKPATTKVAAATIVTPAKKSATVKKTTKKTPSKKQSK